MPQDKLFPAQFMHQPKEVRDYLCQMWKIPRSGISEVRDNEVVSDGHTLDDLSIITLERMCEYIGSKETFARAWEITVSKAYSELHPPVGEIKMHEEDPILVTNADDIPTEIIKPHGKKATKK